MEDGSANTGTISAVEPELRDTPREGSAEADSKPVAVERNDDDPKPNDPAADESGRPRSRSTKARRSRPPRVAALYRAMRSGRPVPGRVERVIKGGYQVRLSKSRGFCPHSQMDLQRVEDPDRHVGCDYSFRVIQIRRGGSDVVISRRLLLEEQRAEEGKAVRATLIEGAIIQGRVAGLAEFGAFIDLGAGVMGLAHVSELAHGHVARVEDAVNIGDVVRAKILKLDDAGGRISLSLRQAQRDPWSEISERFRVGEVYPGTVRRVAGFGAFVELAEGVEALAPASEFPPSRRSWNTDLEVGQSGRWLLLSIDPERRRISVTPPVEGFDPAKATPLEVGGVVRGKVQRVEKFGVFVWLAPGRVGMVPASWSGAPAGSDLGRRFSVGDEIEVCIVEVDESKRRIRLACKGVELRSVERPAPDARRAGRREKRRPAAKPQPAEISSDDREFGTLLADKLRAALGADKTAEGAGS